MRVLPSDTRADWEGLMTWARGARDAWRPADCLSQGIRSAGEQACARHSKLHALRGRTCKFEREQNVPAEIDVGGEQRSCRTGSVEPPAPS